MKKVFLFLIGLILVPAYPFLKKWQGGLSEKMRIGEKVVVVIRKDGRKKQTFVT